MLLDQKTSRITIFLMSAWIPATTKNKAKDFCSDTNIEWNEGNWNIIRLPLGNKLAREFQFIWELIQEIVIVDIVLRIHNFLMIWNKVNMYIPFLITISLRCYLAWKMATICCPVAWDNLLKIHFHGITASLVWMFGTRSKRSFKVNKQPNMKHRVSNISPNNSGHAKCFWWFWLLHYILRHYTCHHRIATPLNQLLQT